MTVVGIINAEVVINVSNFSRLFFFLRLTANQEETLWVTTVLIAMGSFSDNDIWM